jgi:hypothetical protein
MALALPTDAVAADQSAVARSFGGKSNHELNVAARARMQARQRGLERGLREIERRMRDRGWW